MTSARSTKGCHTCRVRKKKCDEGHPVCANCANRDIPCYGYDPEVSGKQHWAQVEISIRKAAERNYRERRKRRSQIELEIKLDKAATGVRGHRGFDIPPCQLITWDSTTTTQASSPLLSPHTPPFSSPQSGSAAQAKHTTSDVVAMTALVADAGPLSPLTTQRSLFWDGCLSAYTMPGRRQDTLLLVHYLQNVFPLQFGFYPQFTSASSEQRHLGFLDLVLRSKPLYLACLSVSICHHDVMRAGLNKVHSYSIASMDLTRMHSLSLKETKKIVGLLETLKGSELLAVGVETLACVQQLLSVEVFRDVEGSWVLHFEAARSVFHLLCKKIIFRKYASSTSSLPTPATGKALTSPIFSPYFCSLPQSQNSAVSFFLASFLWLDILGQACGVLSRLHWNPTAVEYLLAPHVGTSNTGEHQPIHLDLRRHMGCENWAMVAIMNISSLQAWKANAVSNDQLNTSELQRKASVLLRMLEGGIDTLLRERNTLAFSKTQTDQDSSLVTELFARAATTYLHIVVAGPKPYTPEIRQSVSKTVKILKIMPRRLIIRVSWPYTITGCMAVGGEQDICNEIVEKCIDEGMNSGTAWKGVALMKECWKYTNKDLNGSASGDGFGLVEAMKTLNQKILLC